MVIHTSYMCELRVEYMNPWRVCIFSLTTRFFFKHVGMSLNVHSIKDNHLTRILLATFTSQVLRDKGLLPTRCRVLHTFKTMCLEALFNSEKWYQAPYK